MIRFCFRTIGKKIVYITMPTKWTACAVLAGL